MKPNHQPMRELQIQFETESPRNLGNFKFNLKRKVSAVKLNFTIPLALLLLAFTTTHAQRRLDLSQWQMVWNDEFSYTGTQAQIHHQLFDAPGAKWKQNQWNPPIWGLTSPGVDANGNAISIVPNILTRRDITVENGMLHLGARDYNRIQNLITGKYSGGLDTIHNGVRYKASKSLSMLASRYDDFPCHLGNGVYEDFPGFRYGAFEIRAKLPYKKGNMAAFWLWAAYQTPCYPTLDHYCSVANPNGCPDGPDGCPGYEIDMYESARDLYTNATGDSLHFFSTIQDNIYSDPMCKDCPTTFKWVGTKPWEEFHTYTVVWTPNRVTWFINGNEIRTDTTGIPPVELIIFLTNSTFGEDADPHIIDYIRVFRPSGPNYSMPYFINGKNYTWFARDDPNNEAYVNLVKNTPYTQKYFDRKNSLSGQSPCGSNVIGNMAMVEETSGSVVYYHEGDNKLRMIRKVGETGPISFHPSRPTNLSSGTRLSVEHYGNPTHNIYFTGTDNDIWVHLGGFCTWCGSSRKLDPDNLYPNDASGELLFVPSYAGTAPPRLYYRNTSNVLCYFEYCGVQNKWFRHVTNVNNVLSSLTYSNHGVQFHYRGTDNRVWNVYSQPYGSTSCNSASVTNWQFAPLLPLSGNNDCLNELVADPGKVRAWYKKTGANANTALLAFIEYTASGWAKTVVAQVKNVHPGSSIQVRRTAQGRTEVYFVNTSNRMMVYYERAMPTGVTQWDLAPVEVFTTPQTGFDEDNLNGNPNMTYTKAFPNFIISKNTIRPAEIFARMVSPDNCSFVNFTQNNNTPVWPPRYHENCDRWDQNLFSFTGIQMRQRQPQEGHTQGVRLYPNPTDGMLKIESDQSTVVRAEVFDINGRMVLTSEYPSTIDLSDQNGGMYIVRVLLGNGHQETKQIILTR